MLTLRQLRRVHLETIPKELTPHNNHLVTQIIHLKVYKNSRIKEITRLIYSTNRQFDKWQKSSPNSNKRQGNKLHQEILT